MFNAYSAASLLGVTAAASLVLSNSLITVSRFSLSFPNFPEKAGELKILHLSDLHRKNFGKDFQKLFDKIPKENYDMVCFTGDLVSRTETEFSEKTAFMKKLSQLAPTYFVAGNHELELGESGERLLFSLADAGVTVLRNSCAEFYKNGEKITVCGFEGAARFYKNPDGSFGALPKVTKEYLDRKLLPKREGFGILLAHSPFAFDSYAAWGADLTLCGHVHGGVIRLPLVKGVLSPERKFFPEYSEGVYRKNGKAMVVSRGLGKLRLFNSSEISVIEIRHGSLDTNPTLKR